MSLPVVLLLDEAEDDVFLFRLALRRADVNCDLRVVQDGREALDYLRGNYHYADRQLFPFPAVVVIDYHMPSLSGFDVLSWIREHPKHRQMPVVMVTSDTRPADNAKAHALHATRYFEKSHDFNELAEYVKGLVANTTHAQAA